MVLYVTVYLQDRAGGRDSVIGGFLSDGREPSQEAQPTRRKDTGTGQRGARVPAVESDQNNQETGVILKVG